MKTTTILTALRPRIDARTGARLVSPMQAAQGAALSAARQAYVGSPAVVGAGFQAAQGTHSENDTTGPPRGRPV